MPGIFQATSYPLAVCSAPIGPTAKLSRDNRRTDDISIRAGPAADVIEEKVIRHLDQAGRAERLDHRDRETYRPITIEILMEAVSRVSSALLLPDTIPVRLVM